MSMLRPALALTAVALAGTVTACDPGTSMSPTPAASTSGATAPASSAAPTSSAPASTAAPSTAATTKPSSASASSTSSAGGNASAGSKQASTAKLPTSVDGWNGTSADNGTGKTHGMIYLKTPDTALATLVVDPQMADPMTAQVTNTQQIGNATCGAREGADRACYMKLDGGILILSTAAPSVDNAKLAKLTESIYNTFD